MSKGRFLKPEEAPKSQQRRKGKREKENARRGKGREEKIAMHGCTLSFYNSSFGDCWTLPIKFSKILLDIYNEVPDSLRTADAFPVVASLPPKYSVCEPERQNDFCDVKPF